MNKTTSILVVDDDPAILQLYSELLRTQGYEVWEASTGRQGLQAARDRRPDLVLLDVILPDLSGIEVCRQIKADPALTGLFVVLISGLATSSAHKVEGLEAGADDYLARPLDFDEFLARVRTFVRLRNTTEALRASEQRHARLVEILPEAIGLLDLQGRLLAVNPRAAEMLGYANPGELLDKSVFDLIKPDDHERARADIAATLETGILRNAEYLLLRKNADSFPAEVSVAVAVEADGQPKGLVAAVRDITERKRGEEQLRKLSRAVEQSPAAVVITDPQGNIEHVNAKFTQVTGYSLDEVRGQNPRILKSGQMPPEEYARLWQTITSGREWHGEFHNRKKNGELFWEIASISPILDEAGRVTHFLAVKEDITERKWMETLLRRQRDFGIFLSSTEDLGAAAGQLLKVALENEGLHCGAVYLVNSESKALELTAHHGLSLDFAKRASHFATGQGRDHTPGARRTMRQRPAKPLAGIVQQLESEGLLALETLPIEHGGQVVAVLIVGSQVGRHIPTKTRQAIEALAAQAGGALARIRAEQSSRTNRQLLEKTLDSIRSPVFIIDAAATCIQDCNPAATRVFGYARREMIGHTPALLHLEATIFKQFQGRLEAAVKQKGLVSDFELSMRRKDGTSLPTEYSMTPIRNAAGRIVSWVAVVRDLTERKRIEEELRQLSRRIIEAQEAERQRVARDLHDGVNQLIASAKMRLRKVGESTLLNPAARELLARCDDVLLQALDENRRIAHDLRPADLDALGLTEACRNVCKQLQARTHLQVKCRLARLAERWPGPVELNLFRIVQEALNNIAKHACANTVRLRIAWQKGSLLLEIQDDGRGFDPAAPSAAKRRGAGTGLTNMRERASILGGTCEVSSAPDQGTTITVRVPGQEIKRASP